MQTREVKGQGVLCVSACVWLNKFSYMYRKSNRLLHNKSLFDSKCCQHEGDFNLKCLSLGFFSIRLQEVKPRGLRGELHAHIKGTRSVWIKPKHGLWDHQGGRSLSWKTSHHFLRVTSEISQTPRFKYYTSALPAPHVSVFIAHLKFLTLKLSRKVFSRVSEMELTSLRSVFLPLSSYKNSRPMNRNRKYKII